MRHTSISFLLCHSVPDTVKFDGQHSWCYTGSGANPISTTIQYGIASDECPECLSGSLDLGQDGDGRWGVSWYPVQCQVGDSTFQYSFQGSNPNYIKMAVANTRLDVTCHLHVRTALPAFRNPRGHDCSLKLLLCCHFVQLAWAASHVALQGLHASNPVIVHLMYAFFRKQLLCSSFMLSYLCCTLTAQLWVDASLLHLLLEFLYRLHSC